MRTIVLAGVPKGRWRSKLERSLLTERFTVLSAEAPAALTSILGGNVASVVVLGPDLDPATRNAFIDAAARAPLPRDAASGDAAPRMVVLTETPEAIADMMRAHAASAVLAPSAPLDQLTTEIANLAYQRKDPRRAVMLPVVLEMAGQRAEGRMQDISLGGLRAAVSAGALPEPSKGGRLGLALEVDGAKIAAGATVRWTRSQKRVLGSSLIVMGLQFDELSPETVERVGNVVRRAREIRLLVGPSLGTRSGMR